MQFKFEANQEFQRNAIAAVVDLFEGQIPVDVDPDIFLQSSVPAIPNDLSLSYDVLLSNLNTVQQRNSVQPSTEIASIEAAIELAGEETSFAFPNYSVEMETGTGKTYVYLRTILELFAMYKWRKFIVVVPSVAVREGVLATLDATREHFRDLYNVPYRYYRYDSSRLSQVRQFALSDSIEIMVMTLDSFNKASNLIKQPTDMLQGETPLHLIQATRPILVLDEPQNMESETSVAALASLYPMLALRYSATHRNPYNLVYRLTPFQAYREGLVKKIEVASVLRDGQGAQPYVAVESVTTSRRTLTAKVRVYTITSDGTAKEKSVSVRVGDDLTSKTNNPMYDGLSVEEIDPSGYVTLSGNVEIRTGESIGADKADIFKAQVHYTVSEHFRKQQRLKLEGIKVLSLFFIDKVANYANNGVIRQMFDEAFDDLKGQYPEYASLSPSDAQISYFAQKTRKTGEVELLESSGTKKEDESAYDLIMRDKGRLVSFSEKAAFIFSHSALREGWDNPNVFQICTLNQTASEVKKRQEVGRGVRLAVNQSGERVRDDRVNVLTVIANESYEQYVDSLQSEITAEFGEGGTPPKPPNARKRKNAVLSKARLLSPEFQELWRRISQKTQYSISVDSDLLISRASELLGSENVEPVRVVVSRARVHAEGEQFSTLTTLRERSLGTIEAAKPNLLDLMGRLMEAANPPVRVSRRTLLRVLSNATNGSQALGNPAAYALAAVKAVKQALKEQLAGGIQYEKINEFYEMTLFEDVIPSWEQYLEPTPLRALYDHVIFDSEVERQFAADLEAMDEVRIFVKLPRWFIVTTPIGTYNPDWAIVVEERDEHGQPTGKELLYLVRETKGSTETGALRPDEELKVHCGARHFAALNVSYKVVERASEI